METTHIAEDIVFRGELNFEDKLVVDGSIEGKVKTPGHIEVKSGGTIKGDVQTGDIIVKGQVQGNIDANLIQIASTGKIHGDLSCAQIQIDKGGQHNGVTIMK